MSSSVVVVCDVKNDCLASFLQITLSFQSYALHLKLSTESLRIEFLMTIDFRSGNVARALDEQSAPTTELVKATPKQYSQINTNDCVLSH